LTVIEQFSRRLYIDYILTLGSGCRGRVDAKSGDGSRREQIVCTPLLSYHPLDRVSSVCGLLTTDRDRTIQKCGANFQCKFFFRNFFYCCFGHFRSLEVQINKKKISIFAPDFCMVRSLSVVRSPQTEQTRSKTKL